MFARMLVILGLCLLHSSSAWALEPLASGSSVALLPAPEAPKGDRLGAGLADAVRELGYQVVTPDETATRLGSRLKTLCPTSQECELSTVREALAVDAVALYVLLKGGGAPQLLVRVAREAGENEATHELGEGDRAKALHRVMGHALGGHSEIRLTTVLITSVPPRALVSVDRKPVQEAPARFVVVPGKHTFRGRLRGYAPVVEQVEVPAQDVPFDYQLTLPQQLVDDVELPLPQAGTSTSHDTGVARPSAWNYLIAGTLGVAAVGLGAYAVVLAAQDGKCSDRTEASGTCYATYDNGMDVVGTGIGAGVSALGALAFLIWTPITVTASPDLSRLQLQYTSSF